VFCVSVKVKLSVLLLCACALPGKAILEMTYIVSGWMLNPTHSLTHSLVLITTASILDRRKYNTQEPIT